MSQSKREALFDTYLELLRELIRNRCVNTGEADSGNEARSVETLQRFFAGYGLSGEVFTPAKGRSSLLVTLPAGEGGVSVSGDSEGSEAPSLMLMGHLDVVPADYTSWSRDPFGAEVSEGRLWGRGVLDMLGQTAVMAVVLADIYASGLSLPGTLKFLAIADEEAAGNYGALHLVENHWEKVQADYMVTELGGFYLDLPGPPRTVFTIGEKGVSQVRVSTTGEASHGSLPYGVENAALKLVRGLEILQSSLPEPVQADYLTDMVRGFGLPPDLEELLLLDMDRGLAEMAVGSPGTARLLHACSRTTISPNLIRAGSKVNIIPGTASLVLDIRTVPGQTRDELTAFLTGLWEAWGADYKMEFLESFPASISPADTPLAEACRRAADADGDEGAVPVPMLTSVATDGRFWRERGTVVYGFSRYAPDLTVEQAFNRIHGADESLSLESLRLQLDFYRRLPEEFFSSL